MQEKDNILVDLINRLSVNFDGILGLDNTGDGEHKIVGQILVATVIDMVSSSGTPSFARFRGSTRGRTKLDGCINLVIVLREHRGQVFADSS